MDGAETMKSVTITATTKKGTKALKQQYDESRKLKLLHRLQFKAMGYKQTLESTEPFTLRIDITNKGFQNILQPEQFKQQIHEGIQSNGATKKDYKIEVDKDVPKM